MAPRTTPPKADRKPDPTPEPKALHDTAKDGDGNHYGLLLDARPDADGVPTVPATPHTVFVNYPERGSIVKGQPAGEFLPLPGYYRHDRPTPVGGEGEASLQLAIDASRQEGCGVTLVEIPAADVDAARAAHAVDLAAGANVLREQVAIADELEGGDLTRLVDEAGATGQEV